MSLCVEKDITAYAQHIQQFTARQLGSWGETQAAIYCQSINYQVIDGNFRCASGEIDLICQDQETVVFIEVKTRRVNQKNSTAESAISAINAYKKKRILTTAYMWLHRQHKYWKYLRCDAIVIISQPTHCLLTHYQDF